MRTFDAVVRLRNKNQITLPVEIAHALEVSPGDLLVVEVNTDDPGHAVMRPVRDSYHGVLGGEFAGHEEIVAFVRGEQDSWGD